MEALTAKEEPRFDAKINKHKNGCWEWTSALHDSGYGVFHIRGGVQRAHRLSWVRANGTIPEGLCVLHRCDNRRCVNPDHLFLGTRRDNMKDMMEKKRHRIAGVKLNYNTACEIRRRRKAGERAKDLAAEYGVTVWSIYDIVRGRRWGNGPLRGEAHDRS